MTKNTIKMIIMKLPIMTSCICERLTFNPRFKATDIGQLLSLGASV